MKLIKTYSKGCKQINCDKQKDLLHMLVVREEVGLTVHPQLLLVASTFSSLSVMSSTLAGTPVEVGLAKEAVATPESITLTISTMVSLL